MDQSFDQRPQLAVLFSAAITTLILRFQLAPARVSILSAAPAPHGKDSSSKNKLMVGGHAPATAERMCELELSFIQPQRVCNDVKEATTWPGAATAFTHDVGPGGWISVMTVSARWEESRSNQTPRHFNRCIAWRKYVGANPVKDVKLL